MIARDPGTTAQGAGGHELAMAPPASGAARRWAAVLRFARWLPYLVPAVGLSGLFVAYPALDAIRLSFVRWSGFGDTTSIGFDNYARLFGDEVFIGSVLRSLMVAAIITLVTVSVGTAMAVVFDRGLPGRGVFRFLVFLPVILPSTFIAVAWATGLDPYLGWVSTIVNTIDPGTQVNALGGSYAIFVVASVAILQTTGLPMIVVLGALSRISPEIHEAATLEGVRGFQRARKISIPLVRDVIAAIALLQFVWHFAAFEYVFIMTNGGPGTSTEVGSTFIYHAAFEAREFGYAASAAVVTSLVVAIIIMVYFTILRPKAIERAG